MTCPVQRARKLLLGIGLAGIADASRGQEELRLDPQELGDPPALLVALAFAERCLDGLERITHLAACGPALREPAALASSASCTWPTPDKRCASVRSSTG